MGHWFVTCIIEPTWTMFSGAKFCLKVKVDDYREIEDYGNGWGFPPGLFTALSNSFLLFLLCWILQLSWEETYRGMFILLPTPWRPRWQTRHVDRSLDFVCQEVIRLTTVTQSVLRILWWVPRRWNTVRDSYRTPTLLLGFSVPWTLAPQTLEFAKRFSEVSREYVFPCPFGAVVVEGEWNTSGHWNGILSMLSY